MSDEAQQQQQQQLTMFAEAGVDLGKVAVKSKGRRPPVGGKGSSTAISSLSPIQRQQQQHGRKCARCAATFGRFYNTGATCPRCKLRVCRQCRELQSSINSNNNGNDWLCSFCYDIQDLGSVYIEGGYTERWDNHLAVLDILKHSIRRAWSISVPPSRWSASRKSTQFKLYRSLPNRRCGYLDHVKVKNAKKPIEFLIKSPARIIGKSSSKHCDTKKSSIPVFKNPISKEVEDIRTSHESPKRSLIPLKYRGSTDDLRRSREDVSAPSLIPKLLSPRIKEDKLKRPDSKDNQRHSSLPCLTANKQQQHQQQQQNLLLQEAKSTLPCSEKHNQDKTATNSQSASNELYQKISTTSWNKRDESLTMSYHTSPGDATSNKNNVNKEEVVDEPRDETNEAVPQLLLDSSNRRSSSHLSPEASPLSTRSSKYSPRESESEPTPALPRRATCSERSESSFASQRVRDTISRTRRESNSSAIYESSGSEGVSFIERLSGEKNYTPSYVEIARRVKLCGSGSIGPSTGSCEEVLQRDSATSAGEDEHDELTSDPTRGSTTSQNNRFILRRKRQYDVHGPRRRGRSHGARNCCDAELLPVLRGNETTSATTDVSPGALLDYRRLVFISSDSSSGREEDDADSSCSGSSYLNHHYHHHYHYQQQQREHQEQQQQSTSGLEDCDWDYFESGALKLPQLQSPLLKSSKDWICCSTRPNTGCCQTCGGSSNATKVLPVPVPIPVPVLYPVPVPASLWTGDELAGLDRVRAAAAASSMISHETSKLEPLLPLSLRTSDSSTAAAAAAAWFSWSSKFDSTNFLFSPNHFFSRGLSTSSETFVRMQKQEEKIQQEIETQIGESCVNKTESKSEKKANFPLEIVKQIVKEEKREQQQQQEQVMFQQLQEQDSRSSSGRSSAESSDLEDSSSHRFSRVLNINDDSLTSDNDIEDNADSDSARENHSISVKKQSVTLKAQKNSSIKNEQSESVVLRGMRSLDEDLDFKDVSFTRSKSEEDKDDHKANKNCIFDAGSCNRKEIPSFDEIYLESKQDESENVVLLKSIRPINPEFSNDILITGHATRTDIFPALGNLTSQKYQHDVKVKVKKNVVIAVEECEMKEEENNDDSIEMTDSLEVVTQDPEDSYDIVVSNDIVPCSTLSSVRGDLKEGEEEKKVGEGWSVRVVAVAVAAGGKAEECRQKKQEMHSGATSASSFSSSESIDGSGGGSIDATVLTTAGVVATVVAAAAATSEVITESQKEEDSEQQCGEIRHLDSSAAAATAASEAAVTAALMAKTRKKWQIPASFDIKGIPSTHFLPQERRKEHLLTSPLLSAAIKPDELVDEPEENRDEENANNIINNNVDSDYNSNKKIIEQVEEDNVNDNDNDNDDDNDDNARSVTEKLIAHDESGCAANGGEITVRGAAVEAAAIEQVGGNVEQEACTKLLPRYGQHQCAIERRTPTSNREVEEVIKFAGVEEEEKEEDYDDDNDDDDADDDDVCVTTPTHHVDNALDDLQDPVSVRQLYNRDSDLGINHIHKLNNNSNVSATAANNKYRSLVMITQAAYQPVSVIISDTTTLLQPRNQVEQDQYNFQMTGLDSGAHSIQRNNNQDVTKKLPPCKRLLTNNEPEIDSGLSVESASESDDVQSVKNASKQQSSRSPIFHLNHEESSPPLLLQPSQFLIQESTQHERRGPLILEEGLADDDSWVEEISHDEDEASATTATEESSEDESANNLGDREEELRGYHRQSIDFTLHTIVEESCEESESEHISANWRRRLVSASAPDLDKYYFFGVGNENNTNDNSRELDSFSESSSIFSEGPDSLSREEVVQSISREKSGGEFASVPVRLDKYLITDFFNLNQDRRDSDGSVGSDSEGRPSPEAQRRKRLVRARGTGRSHSSSLDNLLALAYNSSTGSHQNSLQDNSQAADGQDSQSEGSSTETDNGADENFSSILNNPENQFDTIKRKKKKPRNIGAQSPRITEDRNKTPEPRKTLQSSVEEQSEKNSDKDKEDTEEQQEKEKIGKVEKKEGNEQEKDKKEGEDEARKAIEAYEVENLERDDFKTSQSENVQLIAQAENSHSSQDDTKGKQTSRDSGFVGSSDDLLIQPRSLEISIAAISDRNNHHHPNHHRHIETAVVSKNLDAKENESKNEKDNKEKSEQSTEADRNIHERILESQRLRERLTKMEATGGTLLSRKDSFNNWSSDEETNLMMSKMRQFFKTMVASSNNSNQTGSTTSGAASPAPSPSPRLSGYSSKTRSAGTGGSYGQITTNRTKPPQLVYFESELTRLMKTVPGIRDEQVREIVEYLSSEDTWSDSYDSSDYTSSDLEGTAATADGRTSALQEQISQSCQQIISKFDTTSLGAQDERPTSTTSMGLKKDHLSVKQQSGQQPGLGRDTAFVYQKLVQSFTKITGDNVASDTSSTSHSSPPLIAKVMHHIGSRLVALMHEVSESNSIGGHYPHSNPVTGWRRYPYHRTPSSASTTEDDDSTSDSTSVPVHIPRSKSHDPLLLINGQTGAASMPPETEEREASDYERFSWRGSFESALMAADSRTKLSLLACSGGDVSSSGSSSTTAMAAKRRSAGDLLFNPKSFSREQLDRVRSCGSIGGTIGAGSTAVCGGGSIEEKIWSNRRSSVPDANTRGESGASAGDEDTENEDDDGLDYGSCQGDSRPMTLPRGLQTTGGKNASVTTNSLPRQTSGSSAAMHKTTHGYHFHPQHNAIKSARYRPPGFNARNNSSGAINQAGPKRAFSAPGLQLQSRSRRSTNIGQGALSSTNVSASTSLSADEASLSEACSTPIIGTNSRNLSSHASMDLDDIDRSLHPIRASLSSLGIRSDSMASVYSGAGEGRWCGSVAVRGEVEFSLQYDYKQLTLEVHVTQCRDLAPVDAKRNRSDPYVKVYLLPDKSKSGKRKTKVKKHTLNPVFAETLKFHTSLNNLESRTLWLTVWHSDMFGRNDFLGEVRVPLENKIFDDPRPQWYPLQERTEPFDDPVAYKGEVIVGLKFVPPDPTQPEREHDLGEHRKIKRNWSRGSLHVLVKEARNLQTRTKNSGTCDPFCKSYLLPDKGRSSKQKTGVVRRSTGSPVWNHTFVYKDVSLQELAERGLELTVWDHDRIASNEFLGGVRFNLGTSKHYGKTVDWMDATGREMSLWQSMLERPNFWVEGAVTLRPNLHNHGKSGTS